MTVSVMAVGAAPAAPASAGSSRCAPLPFDQLSMPSDENALNGEMFRWVAFASHVAWLPAVSCDHSFPIHAMRDRTPCWAALFGFAGITSWRTKFRPLLLPKVRMPPIDPDAPIDISGPSSFAQKGWPGLYWW